MQSLSVNAKYILGLLAWMALYVVILVFSIGSIAHRHPAGLWLDVLAVAPALPIGGTIAVFHRYIDKVDEYIRAVVVKRFITATGLTLFTCTAVGFYENGTGANVMPLYLVYPCFWMMFALASLVHRKAA
jgi:hypothetical protein